VADKKLFCSFCQRSQDDVKHLIAGPDVAVCDECLGELSAILADKDPEWRSSQIERLSKLPNSS
jgi:ATP-dependent Clp protease ATP-binding subunit ClpX